ncbi:MAG: hypothetical protein LBS35_12075 [Synergistaceae bacterium]|jgi:hypothetical protein|nr:hypothetical protein [Synergistaceae bacterium]
MAGKLAALLSLVVFVLGGAAHAGSTIYKNNVLTASHVTVAGTHAAIVPPRGAVVSETFRGFDFPDGKGRVEISESDGAPYRESEGTLTKEGLESLRIVLRDKSPVVLNGSPAVLIDGTSTADASTGVFLLALGNDRMTVYIYGFYADGDKSAASAMKNSLLSCIFNPGRVGNVSEGYTLSTAGTSLKFVDEVGSARYFTPDGKPLGDTVETAFFTSTTADDIVPADARQTYAEAAMGKYLSAYEYTLLSTRSVSYGGLQGTEIIAEFDGTSKRVNNVNNEHSAARTRGRTRSITRKGKAYQVLQFDEDDGKIYIFSGLAVYDTDSYVSQFAKISSSFTKVK